VKNSFINQFSENIKFNYTCFDRVIIRGYILKFFSLTFKTMPTKSSTQPYILEQGVNLINQGLSQITQGLAVNMFHNDPAMTLASNNAPPLIRLKIPKAVPRRSAGAVSATSFESNPWVSAMCRPQKAEPSNATPDEYRQEAVNKLG
jgi:hypothetical protein